MGTTTRRYRGRTGDRFVECCNACVRVGPSAEALVAGCPRGQSCHARQSISAQAAQTGEPAPVGGGWYELPSGQRIQGREAAIHAMTNPEED